MGSSTPYPAKTERREMSPVKKFPKPPRTHVRVRVEFIDSSVEVCFLSDLPRIPVIGDKVLVCDPSPDCTFCGLVEVFEVVLLSVIPGESAGSYFAEIFVKEASLSHD